MGDGIKLAIAILILFLAMAAFFIAFHPHGVALNSDNPDGILQWFMQQFENTSNPGSTPQGNAGAELPNGPASSVNVPVGPHGETQVLGGPTKDVNP